MISRPAVCIIFLMACLIWFGAEAKAQRPSAPAEKKPSMSEMDKLVQEKNDIRKSRLKLLQDESAYHVQYFKPLDRLRKELDLEEADLYAECSGSKDLKSPQYSFCAAELGRFNDNVKYYNERLDGLKSGLAGHKQEFSAKMDDLDKKEREVDRKIALLEKRQR